MQKHAILFFSLMLLYSCGSIMGVTKNKILDNEDMRLFLKQLQINDPVIYFIDKDYKKQLLSLTNDTALIKNHLQPLQASYYNKEGELISFHVNCYAPGFPNLNWNYKNAMETFPPRTQTPADTLLNLARHLKYLKSNIKEQTEEEPGYDYFIIVNWAGFLKKQSTGLINAVNKNVKLNVENKRVKIIFVCSDNVFIE